GHQHQSDASGDRPRLSVRRSAGRAGPPRQRKAFRQDLHPCLMGQGLERRDLGFNRTKAYDHHPGGRPMRKAGVLAVAIAMALLGLSTSANCLDISELLSKIEGDQGFRIIHVAALAAMMSKPGSHVMVFDANPVD